MSSTRAPHRGGGLLLAKEDLGSTGRALGREALVKRSQKDEAAVQVETGTATLKTVRQFLIETNTHPHRRPGFIREAGVLCLWICPGDAHPL